VLKYTIQPPINKSKSVSVFYVYHQFWDFPYLILAIWGQWIDPEIVLSTSSRLKWLESKQRDETIFSFSCSSLHSCWSNCFFGFIKYILHPIIWNASRYKRSHLFVLILTISDGCSCLRLFPGQFIDPKYLILNRENLKTDDKHKIPIHFLIYWLEAL
jgi:hypothetical protein